VEIVAWQAIKLSTTMAAADDQRFRTWAARIIRSTSSEVLERIGIDRDTILSVLGAFAVSGESTAGSLVPDDVVSRLVLSGDPEEVASQLLEVEARGIDSISIIGFGNTEVVQDTLRRFALDVMARPVR
jgi:alkanesulfonate monooxygenase SsuD/methylene tetrahydromethanopterin reductase-like flavin-dependent oxidoreductase (luciferase family)